MCVLTTGASGIPAMRPAPQIMVLEHFAAALNITPTATSLRVRRAESGVDTVIHAAPALSNSPIARALETDVTGTANIVAESRRAGVAWHA